MIQFHAQPLRFMAAPVVDAPSLSGRAPARPRDPLRSSRGERGVLRWMALGLCVALAACTSNKPEPKPLTPNIVVTPVRQAWVARVGDVGSLLLTPTVTGNTLWVASADGAVTALDGNTGAVRSRVAVGQALTAGVGSDGETAAVITRDNHVVALDAQQVLWSQRISAQGYTAPLVAGGRVFVLAADRSVSAFDGKTGARLWRQTRTGEALVLQQSGVMMAVGDTLVVGQAGRLVGLNPNTGLPRWEVAIANPRGTNDVERLVDMVAGVSRVDGSVCARAFQANVGCVDAQRGVLQWSKPAAGGRGVHGDAQTVVGTESDGRVIAWRRADGERAWMVDRLLYRDLSAPLVVGRTVALGDGNGNLHLMSVEDGKAVNRLSTDGSRIVTAPVLVGNTIVAITRQGGVYGFVPE